MLEDIKPVEVVEACRLDGYDNMRTAFRPASLLQKPVVWMGMTTNELRKLEVVSVVEACRLDGYDNHSRRQAQAFQVVEACRLDGYDN